MTAIVGPNGAGKSTLVEAILFALYGEQRDKKETIRFSGATGKKFSVTLEFSFDAKRYVVQRTHADASLTQENPTVLRAHGLAETTRACERLLSLTYDQFVNSFCAEQKGLAFLHFRTNAARQDEVARMLGFDRLRLAEDLAGQRRREAALQREALSRNLGDEEALREDRKRAEERRREAAATEKRLAKEISSLEKAVRGASEARQLAERWLTLEGERLALSGVLTGLRTMVELTRKSLAQAEAEAREKVELSAPAQAFVAAQDRLRRFDAAEAARSRAAEIDEELSLMGETATVEELREALEQETAHAATLRERTRTAEAALARAERSLAAGVCPECGQPIAADYGQVVEERRREALAVRTELEQVQASDVRARLSVAERAAALTAERVGLLEQVIEDESIDEVRRTVEQTRGQHERWIGIGDPEARLAARKKDHALALSQEEEARASLLTVDAQRVGFPFSDQPEASAAVTRHQELTENLARLRAEQSAAASARDLAERDLRHAEERLAAYAALAAEIRALAEREALHDLCAREMRILRQELNASIGPDLAARASENLSLLTNGRYVALELDKNFAPSIIEDGTAKPVISGGEEDVVALALRLALSELIQERQGHPMSLLILDEVFGSLDAERRQAVLDRLTALKGRFDQILVITHLEEVQQIADQTLHLRRDPSTRATAVFPA